MVSRSPGRCRRCKGDPRIQCEHPVRICEKRIHVELDDLWQIDEDLRDLDECEEDPFEVRGGTISISLQQPRDACAGHQLARQVHVQRWKGDGAIRDHLDRDAPAPEENHGAKHRVRCIAHDQLVCARPAGHLLGAESHQPRRGPVGLQPFNHPLRRLTHCLWGLKIEGDASHVGLVGEVG